MPGMSAYLVWAFFCHTHLFSVPQRGTVVACLFACIVGGRNYITRMYTMSSSIFGAFHRQLKFHRIKLPDWLCVIKIVHVVASFSITDGLSYSDRLFLLPRRTISQSHFRSHGNENAKWARSLLMRCCLNLPTLPPGIPIEKNPVFRRNCMLFYSTSTVVVQSCVHPVFFCIHSRPHSTTDTRLSFAFGSQQFWQLF